MKFFKKKTALELKVFFKIAFAILTDFPGTPGSF